MDNSKVELQAVYLLIKCMGRITIGAQEIFFGVA